jgi:hypothetical protein
MKDLVQLLLLVVLAGAAVTVAGSVALWLTDEVRGIRRALKRVLGAEPEILLTARGRGRGAGASLETGLFGVAWDSGKWCLVYRLDELMGAELIIDGQVVARAYRDEPRRALDQMVEQAGRVTLRLVFDDPRHPDFELDLWQAGDERRRSSASPALAVKDANQWLARAESILRRPRAGGSQIAQTPPPIVEPPPWDDDDLDNEDDER